MAGNKHIKRYKALADLQQALSEGKITSPGIIALDDESVHYDNNLKSIYPQYVINKGDFDWESFKIYNVKPEEDTPVETIFSLDKEFYYAKAEGDSFKLNITSNKPWTCTYDSNYCSVSSSSGDGNKSITINTFYSEYSANTNIEFYVENKKVTTFLICIAVYRDMPLTLEALTDGTIYYSGSINYNNNNYNDTIQYSINGQSLQTSNTRQGVYINAKNGDRIMIFGDSKNPKGELSYTQFGGTARFNVYGNIKSLFNWDDNYMYSYCCYRLFRDSNVYNAGNLILPAIILSNHCYENMFFGCDYLTTAPALPATILAEYCYSGIFCYCNQLNGIPSNYLSATTLANGCYSCMFHNCINLTSVPSLPATTLANYCYEYMFSNCLGLTSAPELPATILANGCYLSMFNGCTSLRRAPELPAITLVEDCYFGMFNGCTNLNYIKCLAINIPSESSALYEWTKNVSNSGTFIKHPNTSWTTGDSGIPSNWTVENDYSIIPLTFEILEDGEIIWKSSSNYTRIIEYNKNESGWTSITSSTNGTSIQVYNGDKIKFRGNTVTYGQNTYCNYFNSSCSFNVYGNIMSLLYSNNFYNENTFDSNNGGYCFFSLFSGSKVISAENLILPSTTLTQSCYVQMFYNCTSLITAPKLPATILAQSCYGSMFQGCISLISAPNLPARALSNNCYASMFKGCNSLISPPEIKATSGSSYCCSNMFRECTSLTSAPDLNILYLSTCCYEYMFYNCTSLTKTAKHSARSLANSCYRYMYYGCSNLKTILCSLSVTPYNSSYEYMFGNCTSLTNIPKISPSSLAESCYSGTFSGCTALTAVPAKLNGGTYPYCYAGMFAGCTSLEIAPILPDQSPANYAYYNMFGNCIKLKYVMCMANGSNSNNCFTDWLSNVPAGGTFIKSKDSSWATSQLSGIPGNWNVMTNDYLTFECLESGSITFKHTLGFGNGNTIYYSKNNSDWISITSSQVGTTISVSNGDIIKFKGNQIIAYGNSSNLSHCYFETNCNINISGNINSLAFEGYTNFLGTDYYNDYYFYKLFENCKILNANNLILPPFEYGNGCYCSLFYNVTSLISAPSILPTTDLSLSPSCYKNMFYNCDSLTSTPELPATVLSNNCYESMFESCNNITSVSKLPAIKLVYSCYQAMFKGCTSLITAPDLPAIDLYDYCYCVMFYNCTHLNYIKCLAINRMASNCLYSWLYNVASSGTFVKNPDTSWSYGDHNVPNNWTIQDAA